MATFFRKKGTAIDPKCLHNLLGVGNKLSLAKVGHKKKKKKENGGVAHPMCVVSVALSPLVRNAGDAVVEASRVCGHLKRGKDKHHHSFLSKFLSSLGTE